MPITAKQFELGIDSAIERWMREIHRFLASRKEEAFTRVELAQELDGFTPDFKKMKDELKTPMAPLESYMDEPFKVALDKLVEVEAVNSRIIRMRTYYALGNSALPV